MTKEEKREAAKIRLQIRKEAAIAFSNSLIEKTNNVAGSTALGKVGKEHHLTNYDNLCWFILDHAGQNVTTLENVLHIWRKSTALVGEAKKYAKRSLVSAITIILDKEYTVTLSEKTNGDLTKLEIVPVKEIDEDDAAAKALRAIRRKFPDMVLKTAFSAIMLEERDPISDAAKAKIIAKQREVKGAKQAATLAAEQFAQLKLVNV